MEFVRKVMKLFLIVIFIFSIGMLLKRQIQNHSALNSYDYAESLVTEEIIETIETSAESVESEASTEMQESEVEPTEANEPVVWTAAAVEDDPYLEEMIKKDLSSLREINQDVLGWIWIPDTNVNYPIMDGDDNDYYLEHTWDRQPSVAGSIFLEQLNDSELSDFNTIFYGHRMNNGSMFGSLKYYNDRQYFEDHPFVYVLDDNMAYRYEIFSAYTAPVNALTFTYGFRTEESMQKFLDYCVESSVIETGIVPTLDDRILTLVTCTGRGYEARWVVQARVEGIKNNPRKLYGQENN